MAAADAASVMVDARQITKEKAPVLNSCPAQLNRFKPSGGAFLNLNILWKRKRLANKS